MTPGIANAGCALLALLALAGCAPASQQPIIRLAALEPLPTPLEAEIVPLRVSVAAVISPKGTAESYRPLLDYLADRLGRPVELVQRQTYAETNDLIEQGAVDLAFVCTSAYIAGRDDFGMELLAAPVVNGETVYYSLLIVPAGSPARSMADLEGKVFAFTDPMSFSGRVYPTYLVQQLRRAPEDFFARTFFTYNHDDAIRAVAAGLADGAAVDSVVYDFALARESALAAQVRVIHRSPPFGMPPVVVGPGVRPQVKAALEALLLGMADDPEGQAALRALGVERFAPVEDRAYGTVRALIKAVGPLSP
mgnify:CR=1 FL=1